jgi:carboxypeptidase family protein
MQFLHHKKNMAENVLRRLLLLTFACCALASGARAFPQQQGLSGQVVDEKGAPIQGAVCTLTGRMLPVEGLPETTGENGHFEFTSLLPGSYDLTCAAVGHEPVQKTGLDVTAAGAPFVQFTLPAEVIVHQKIEVHAKSAKVVEQTAARATLVTSKILQSLPLVQQKFMAALPLVPGVIRTPDGRINIKGASESQGMLLVDSAEAVDPVTGSFSIDVPIDAVESLSVFKSAYVAEYGQFSGGLTTIQTKAPSSQWDFELNDFVPSPRIRSGHLVGIEDDEPRLSFSGPLWGEKLNFAEYFVYDYAREPVRGLAWPNNETKRQGYTSLTEFQYISSPRHFDNLEFSLFPLRREFVNINSFIPQSASSNYDQGGFSVDLGDHYLFESGAVLSTVVKETRFLSNAHGQGPLDMIITPDLIQGNYFNTWDRNSNQQEITQTVELPRKHAWGNHDFKFGADFIHRSYRGTSDSRPVLLQRENGTLAEEITFQGSHSLAAADTEVAVFVGDHWAFDQHVAVDMGMRASTQTLGEPSALAPRAGVVYSPGSSGKTIFRGGFGVFYDRLPLLAGDFTANPTRVVTMYDDLGNPIPPPIVYQNFYRKFDEEKGIIVPSGHHLDSTPFNLTWSAEMDQEIQPGVVLRLSYLNSRTYDEFVVSPLTPPTGNSLLLLTNTGASRYHEFESTLRIRRWEKADINISYIRSLARGDLNTLSQLYVPFEQPVIRPNLFGELPSNVPNRLVTWSTFQLPVGVTASPIFDVHSGFPYSALDVFQNYVGPPNSLRFPTFLSLDLKLSRNFSIPLIALLKKHKFRGSVEVFNLTNHLNPRDVFTNVTSPFFGQFVGFQHRFYDVSLDIVY